MTIRYSNIAGTIYRAERDENHPYTIVSNMIARDKRLGYIAKGIMLELLSNKDDWIIVKSEMFKRSEVGRKHFNDAWELLERYGYIEKMRIRGGWMYNIAENPVFIASPTNDTGVRCTDVI